MADLVDRADRLRGSRNARQRLLACVVGALAACGGGVTEEAADRSMREFQLAATYRTEGNVPGALQHLDRSLELDPDNARAHLLLGYIHLGRQNLPKAANHLRTGIRILKGKRGAASTLAEARNVLGVVLMRQRKHDEAIVVLKDSAADMLNAAPWFAWGNLGRAYLEKGQHKQAVEALEQATRIQPRFCVGHYLLGQTLFEMSRYPRAEESLTRALEADNRCGEVYQDAWKLRGETRAHLGQREDALHDFERCVEIAATTDTGRSCQRLLDSD